MLSSFLVNLTHARVIWEEEIFFLFFFICKISLSLWVLVFCLHVCVRVPDPIELELQTVVSDHGGTGD